MRRLKPLKKADSGLPKPYLNFMDPDNVDFLMHASEKTLLKIDLNNPILSVDHRSIEKLIEEDNELPDLKDIAFIGRSNVGKSSLVNMLVGSQVTKTSKTPGKTKELTIMQLPFNRRVIDCPGYGFAAASTAEKEQWRKFM